MAHAGGRPRLDAKFTFNHWRLLEMLCGLPMVVVRNEDIAAMMRTQEGLDQMSLRTLERIIKSKYKLSFVEFRKENQGVVKARLLTKQFELALKGNTGLLIWLGKQYLGQSDHPAPIDDDRYDAYPEPKTLTDAEVKASQSS